MQLGDILLYLSGRIWGYKPTLKSNLVYMTWAIDQSSLYHKPFISVEICLMIMDVLVYNHSVIRVNDK